MASPKISRGAKWWTYKNGTTGEYPNYPAIAARLKLDVSDDFWIFGKEY